MSLTVSKTFASDVILTLTNRISRIYKASTRPAPSKLISAFTPDSKSAAPETGMQTSL